MTRLVALFLRPQPLPAWLGAGVAICLIAVETAVVHALDRIAPGNAFGALFLLGVLVVSAGWGFRVAVMTTLGSALVYTYVHLGTDGGLVPARTQDVVAIAVFLPIALLANLLVGQARSRAAEAEQRRVEADLAVEALRGAARDREVVNKQLAASRKDLDRFFDLSSDLLCIGGTERLVRVNTAYERALGHRSDGLLSRPPLEFVHPDDLGRTRHEIGKALQGNEAQFENRCMRVDGSVRWLEWNVVQDKELVYAAGRDVTERRLEQEQQAALRRVATLVARGISPSDVFSAVADELARCLGVAHSAVVRFEPDGAAQLIAAHHEPQHDTIRAARLDRHDDVSSLARAWARELDLDWSAGTPVVVDGRVWGAALVGCTQSIPVAAGTEVRVRDFAELLALAISNADARAELTASRARIVAASDDARRRFERDLHDGAQQRLVSVALELRAAEGSLRSDSHPVTDQISDIVAALTGVSDELREISRGIHPAILSRGGLRAALKALARRSAVPVALDLDVEHRLPQAVEVAGYYLVAEALTNAAKHARASLVTVTTDTGDAHLRVTIDDDGIGGADAAKGSGLIGLIDRLAALGGRLDISSRAGAGTSLAACIPFDASA